MDVQYLICNGTVVDGTGAPAYRADVRVRDGKIAEIAPTLTRQGRERVIDATECYVTPGTIEHHNHWDGAMWWAPMMEPMAGYGITTSINGNCGFSVAPCHPEQDLRKDIIDIFNYFEDVPEKPMYSCLTWDWHTWSEYMASLRRNVRVQTNIGFFCGHVALRFAVLGKEAWDRAATADEIRKMCALLDDAMQSGAVGLSSNMLDYDRHERPLPTFLADDDEWRALMGVLTRYPGSSVQVPLDNFARMTAAESGERLGRLAKEVGHGVRLQLAGLPPTLLFQEPYVAVQEALYERLRDEGVDAWASFIHVGPTLTVNFHSSLLFASQGNFVWQEVVNEPDENKKLAMLADPEWRARARVSWDGQYTHTALTDPTGLLLRESQTGNGPIGVTLAEYMTTTGIDHPSDAMAEWALDNGPVSTVQLRTWALNEELLLRKMLDPFALTNLSDSGAHTSLFCGVGDNVQLLTEYVRDRKLISIELAVHSLSGKVAQHFGLHNRGAIEVGKQADVVVFNLAEIERRPEIKVWDVPDGVGGRAYRYTRPAAPMRLTLVNGVATFDNGDVTGNFPGDIVGPMATRLFAEAAE